MTLGATDKSDLVVCEGVTTLIVPQGIGDLLWVWRKLNKYWPRVKYIVATTDNGVPAKIQKRSESFALMFPGVEGIEFQKFSPKVLEIVCKKHHDPCDENIYCVNYGLEHGYKIEDIDPAFGTEWDLKTGVKWAGAKSDYLLWYVSGDSIRHGVPKWMWPPAQWSKRIKAMAKEIGVTKTVGIGADFDHDVQKVIQRNLIAAGLKTDLVIGESPMNVLKMMAGARHFIGYQSGMSMMAEEVQCPQTFVVFPMYYSWSENWVRPENRKNRALYRYECFSPEQNHVE